MTLTRQLLAFILKMTIQLKSLEELKKEYAEVEKQLSDPELFSRPADIADLGRKLKELNQQIRSIEEKQKIELDIEDVKKILSGEQDLELRALAEQEKETLEKKLALLTSDHLQNNKEEMEGVVMEIRPGAGGDEAALFTTEIARMYIRFAEKSGWRVQSIGENDTSIVGQKEAIFIIRGKGAYKKLKNELGVHRVQRIPETEKNGRLHTSTVTVVVIPEAHETDLEIKPQDIRVDFQRATGPGGQNVNKRETAIRLVHLPTGIIVTSQKERTQQSNKDAAMSILRSKLLALKKEEEAKTKSEIRKTQIGTGDRSDKIRTYNFPQDRVTDHRIKKSWHNINGIMEGNIEEMVQELYETKE